MTEDQAARVWDELMATFPKVERLVTEGEMRKWMKTFRGLDHPAAMKAADRAREELDTMPSHSWFIRVAQEYTPRAPEPEPEPLPPRASPDVAKHWLGVIRRQLADAKGPLARTLDEAVA